MLKILYTEERMNNTAHIWTIIGLIAMFVAAGLGAIMPQIPSAYTAVAEAILGIETYFAHNSAVITAGKAA